MENLKALGKASQQPQRPEDAELERVPNPHPDTNFVARFTQPEFTSLCPVTAQPDFPHLVIHYVPAEWMVESKSLKLYLNSFRNHQSFHEACTVGIGKQLVDLLAPRWLRIGGYCIRVAVCRLMCFGSMASYQLAHGCPIKGSLVTVVAAKNNRLFIANFLVFV